MAVEYRKLLSSKLRNQRWGDIIDAYQMQVQQLDEQVVFRILQKEDIDLATDDELKLLFYEFGYDLPSFEGYTSTTNFIKKQISVIIPQIINKTTPLCYNYVFYVYNMIGAVYPLGYNEQEKIFKVVTDPGFRRGEQREFQVMDQEQPYIDFQSGGIYYPNNPPIPSTFPLLLMDATFSEDPNAQALYLDGIAKTEHTPHYGIRYFYRWIENADEFHSVGTVKSLFNSVKQLKRATRVPHYQVSLDLTSTTDAFEIDYRAELDESITAKLEGLYIAPRGSEVAGIYTVQFGVGAQVSPLSGSITGCETPVWTTVIEDDFYLRSFAAGVIELEDIILEYGKRTFGDNFFFSEFALIDNLGNCMFYAKFPKIRFAPEMYSSVRLLLNFIVNTPNIPIPDLSIESIDGDTTSGMGYGSIDSAQMSFTDTSDGFVVVYTEE